jgi:hypothetical protein
MAKSELPEKNMIIDEWDRWAKNNVATGQRANDLKALAFYGYLSSEKPGLLGFDFAGETGGGVVGNYPRCCPMKRSLVEPTRPSWSKSRSRRPWRFPVSPSTANRW